MAGLCKGGNEPPGSLKAISYLASEWNEGDNAGEMSPESSTESHPAFARIELRENPGKNLNQVTCPDRDSNPGHLVSRPDPDRYSTVYKLTTLVPTVDQGADAGIEEICVKSLKPRHDGLPNGHIGVESITTQMLFQRSEEMEITMYQVGTVGRMVQYLPLESPFCTVHLKLTMNFYW
ncbi:hypothetical protein ANN_18563 [Periplaneta americana]|uniref:Uncharacterized protein n=1 Tax=Periplaneta americana TaxID=6978 RepID=A0ABQ8SP36_PERAM|nr:hypothetical protein ANN_18563 [Periplaneta americana]